MSKLVDIKGYWNMSGGCDFNEKDSWEGRLLLEDDGWFEGIVVDPSSPYVGDRFIFGVYHPNKIIELLKVSPEDVSDPFVFRGKKEENGYKGNFSVLGFFGEIGCGASYLATQDIEELNETKRNIEVEKEELLKRIDSFKQKNDFEELYENTIQIRSKLSEYLLSSYEGKKFTREEIEEIVEPVQEDEEEVKRLVKEKKHNIFDLDDELPF